MKNFVRFLVIMLALTTSLTLCSCEYFSGKEEEKANDIKAAVYESDIATLREAILNETISCRDLTNYYLERIEKYNDEYNCFITLCDDAIDIAAERDVAVEEGKAEGLLFGIPVLIKDNMDYEGYETTNGHIKGSSNRLVTENAYVVERLLAEGAIIIGKTNMATDAETAVNSCSEAIGDTKNAYNTDCSPGGSSGGSAAGVSLNFAVVALGTDTNSSLRIPAAFNGDVSLRSTFGLIDKTGIVPLNETRDVAGAITRSVADQAVMMDVLTDSKHNYSKKLKMDALKGAKIGVINELSVRNLIDSGSIPIDDKACELFSAALDELEDLGAEIVNVSLPVYKYEALCWDSNTTPYRTEFYNIFKKVMIDNGLTAMVYPDTLSPEMYLENPQTMDFFDACKYVSPIIGVPDITVQIGNLDSGVGVGMGIVADKNQEQLLLDIANSYTSKYNHRKTPKGAPNLYESNSEKTLQELGKKSLWERIFSD